MDTSALTGNDFLIAEGIKAITVQQGWHDARRLINKKTQGHANRLLKRFDNLIPSHADNDMPDLDGEYQRSLVGQIRRSSYVN